MSYASCSEDEFIDYSFSESEEHDYDYVRLDRDGKRTVPQLPTALLSKTLEIADSTGSASTFTSSASSSCSSYLHRTDVTIQEESLNCVSVACCVACHEKSLLQHDELCEDRIYENCRIVRKVDTTTELYGRLLSCVLIELLDQQGGAKRLRRVQKKVERLLQLPKEYRISSNNYEQAVEHIRQFACRVELRLRALRDISVVDYRKISDELCSVLSAARSPSKGALSRLTGAIRSIFSK